MTQLKIIVATHDFVSPIRGGGGLRTIKTAIELNKRGHIVRVMAPANKNNIAGVEVLSLPHISKDQSFILTALKFMLIFMIELFRMDKIDLIFVHNSVAGIPAIIYAKIFNKKVIIDATDIHTEYIKVSYKRFPLKIFVSILSNLEYSSLKHANKIIVVSNAMKDLLIKRGVDAKKLHIVYDGVEVDNFSIEKNKKNKYTVIHHGGIDVQDGVHYIAEAAPLILAKYPDTEFLIVGGGKCIDFVKDTAKRNRVDKSFIFTGWKPYEEMRDYLKLADIGLITRPDTIPNNTILTLKLLEYWASGTAVVSSRLKGIEEVSKENSDIVFFEPDNPEDLAEKVIGLMDDPRLLSMIRKNGKIKSSHKFNWNALIKEIADITED